MQVNNYSYSNRPAFQGLTKVFKHKLFTNTATYEQILNFPPANPYIGALPQEIIRAISLVNQNNEQKTAIIKKVMEMFSRSARELQGTERGNNSILYIKASNKAEFREKQKLAARRASKILTEGFKSFGLLKKGERVVVSGFKHNEGMFGVVYSISFPKRINCTKKVIKMFKDIKKQCEWKYLLPIHGLPAEINAAMFIKKHQAKNYKKSVFVQPYFASLKDKFMVLEHVNSYQKTDCKKHSLLKAFEKLNIHSEDVSPGASTNMLNGRIFDYGGFVNSCADLTPGANKVYLDLKKAEIISINTGNIRPLIAKFVRYADSSQKNTKLSPFDVRCGVETFMSETAFSESTKTILVKLKLFKPEQINTY